MKPELVKRYDTYSEYKIKYKRDFVHFYVDNDKCEKVEKLTDLQVYKNKFKDINDMESVVYKNRILCGKNRKSFLKEIMENKNIRNYFLKDTYTNKNEKLLDYRVQNITNKQSEIYGYSNMAKSNYEKQDKEYLINCMREKRYTKNYSRVLAKSKTGDINPAAKLTKEIVDKIREERYLLGYTQQVLADKYNVGRATIGDIVNYRTWVLKDDLSLRKYKVDNKVIINSLDYVTESCMYDRLKGNYILLDIPKEEIFIYLEKLPIERLLYMEIRDRNHNFIANSDLFFPIDNERTNCILASCNPVKAGRNIIYKHVEIVNKANFNK